MLAIFSYLGVFFHFVLLLSSFYQEKKQKRAKMLTSTVEMKTNHNSPQAFIAVIEYSVFEVSLYWDKIFSLSCFC